MRGLAILLVLAVHLTWSGSTRTTSFLINSAITLRSYGWIGVDLFFVLSGFLITGILYDSLGARSYFTGFYARRFLRIFPLYYGTLLLLLVFSSPMGIAWNGSETILLGYLQNIPPWLYEIPASVRRYTGHFWSLAVEEQFYLVWPCVVFFVRDRRRLITTALVLAAIAPAIRIWVVLHGFNPEFTYKLTICRMDSLLIGGALALAVRGPAREKLISLAPIVFLVGFLSSLSISLYLNPLDLDWEKSRFDNSIGYTLLAISFAALIASALRPLSLTERLFKASFLRWFGKYSYGIYIFHFILCNLPLVAERPREFIAKHLHSKALGVLGGAIPTLVLSLVLAWLSYRFYETPFLRLKKRFEPQKSATPAAIQPEPEFETT